HNPAKKGEKEDPDTHRITHKAGPTGGSEFNANRGSGFSANQQVRRLVETHDYAGICLYLYDELKNSNLDVVVRDLIVMTCHGIIQTAHHDQSRRHRCGCFLRIERYKEALGLADSLARSNPDNPDFQILLAHVMTCLPECQDAARSLSGDIKRRYKLSDTQLAAIEAVSSEEQR
ncbi:hypothetical protein AB3X82_28095, partial [Paraburkholderia phenoliruptrix]